MYQPNHLAGEREESCTFAEHTTGDRSILQRVDIENAAINNPVTGDALIQRADLRTDRSNRPYLAMTLQCAGGATIEARWWHFPHPSAECPAQGTVYQITARVDVFQGERQLRVTSALPVPTADLSGFLKSSRRSGAELVNELDAACSSLDDQMRAIVEAVLSDDNIRADFYSWPASHQRHGAVRHGLLAHSLRVADLVQRIADTYGVGGLEYDRSLAVTAVLLHDIGKLPSFIDVDPNEGTERFQNWKEIELEPIPFK